MLVSGGKVLAIDRIKTNSATVSGDGVWTELGLNTSAVIDPIKNDISSLSSNVNKISGDLNSISGAISAETTARENADNQLNNAITAEIQRATDAENLLSAAIDTKQKKLSAGDNIQITPGEEYDTISVTGIKPTTYFATPYNRHTSSDYFNFNLDTLSANSEISYFNLSIGYKVSTSGTEPYNAYSAYSACIEVNNELVDTHYIIGNIPFENHFISKNILNNNENKTYKITIDKANELNISDIDITCVGYIGDTDSMTIGVLGTSGSILTFGNTILRA